MNSFRFLQAPSGPFRLLQAPSGSFKFLTESWEHWETPWPSCNVLFLLLLREPLPDTNQEAAFTFFCVCDFFGHCENPLLPDYSPREAVNATLWSLFSSLSLRQFFAKGSIVKKKHWKCPLRLLLLLAFWDVNFIHGNVMSFSIPKTFCLKRGLFEMYSNVSIEHLTS